jgi:4-methylaminobutanoate oxidase (formaldehyde-forming)
VKPDKRPGRFGSFVGREAVLARQTAGLRRRLLQFQLLDPEPLLFHNEPILRDGRIVGRISSGAYGHHLGAAIGLGYVPVEPGEGAAEILSSAWEIDIAGTRVAARASLRPLYDPGSLNPRA